MSAEEILAELPKLSLSDVEAIYQRADSLLHDEASSELLAVIDEANSYSEAEDLSVDQICKKCGNGHVYSNFF